ncbi:MAG: VCBS repeat-containing protein [Deltaproteobacteria bacterium]|nr:VCBS repeat-containing protein [Deltaproteobacteria bacterium]
MSRNKKLVATLISLTILLFCMNQQVSYAQVPIKVAILPVKIHAPEKMDYLQRGLMDILESHIGGKEGIEILDRNLVAKTFDKFKKDLNETTARSLAQDLGADYLVAGSVTFFGTGGSIDFEVFAKDPSKATFTTYKIIKDKNNLLPDFSLLADEISAKAFAARPQPVGAAVEPQARQPQAGIGAPAPTPKAAPLQQQAQPQPSPAPTSAEPSAAQPKVASIRQELVEENPPPIETRPEKVVGTVLAPQPEPWKSQKLSYAVFSMDVGDIFGDGSKELVTMSRDKIFVYRYKPEGLEQLTVYRGAKNDRFLWVSVADLNRNGRDEIFVASEKTGEEFETKISSFVLEWDGEKFSVLVEEPNYYFRVVRLPGEPPTLLGQKSTKDGDFLPEIHSLVWKNNSLTPGGIIQLPESADIYNSRRGDITGSGKSETILIDLKRYLVLTDSRGRTFWRSTESYGATENFVEMEIPARDIPQPIDDLKGDAYRFAPIRNKPEGVKYIYLPSPLLLTDLNGDKRLEVIVNHNLAGFAQLTGSREYSKGEILSLTWGESSMLENWKTGEIEGDISSLQVGDLNGDGIEELIVGTTESGGISSLWGGKSSVILRYELTAP